MTGSRWKNLRSKAEQIANGRSHEIVRVALASFVEEHKKGYTKCSCAYCVALHSYIRLKIDYHRMCKRERDYGPDLNRGDDLESLARIVAEAKRDKDAYL